MKLLSPRLSRHKSSRHRGMLLMEMVAYVAIMATVAFLLTDLVLIGINIFRDTNQHDALITRIDIAIDSLRRDTWSASELRTDKSNRLEIKSPQATIVWEISDDGTLTRTQAGNEFPHTWPDMPKISFATQGPLLNVSVDSRTGPHKHEQLTLISQRLAAGTGGGQ